MTLKKVLGLVKGTRVWLFVPIMVLFVVIPKFYVWVAEVPSLDELKIYKGFVYNKKVSSRKGWKVGVRNGKETKLFTCGSGLGAMYNCYSGHVGLHEKEGLEGRSVTVWWYEQPVYLFLEQNRLVRLDVSGETIVSRNDTIEDVRRNASKAPFWVGLYIFVFLLLSAYFVVMEMRKTHGKEYD
ncbi:hypothetical protein [Marinobacter persicus]|uniref:hypothetical protein n=1 Tax=Marinobacter persicus TaxID=930118 RepID=UPI0011600C75|nr:hypothetical protein [Marinobacter persicus]